MTVPLPAQGSRAWYSWATSVTTAVNTGGGTVPDATTTAKGIVEVATPTEAVAGVDSTRAVAPTGLRAAAALPTFPMELVDDFSTKTGTLHGQQALTGQTWTVSGANAGTAGSVVTGGQLVDTSSTGGYATYANIQTANAVTYGSVEFSWLGSSATDGSLAVVVWGSGVSVGATGGPSPLHLVLTPTNHYPSVINSTPAVSTIYAPNTYPSGAVLPTDGTVLTVEFVIDRVQNRVFIRLPDGGFIQSNVDTNIANLGKTFCVEAFYSNAATASKVRIHRVSAHSYPIGRDANAARLRFLGRLSSIAGFTY